MNRARQDELVDWLVAKVALAAGLPRAAIDENEPINAYGIDSAAIVALSGEVGEHLGRDIAPDIFFEYPSIAAVSDYLVLGRERLAPVRFDTPNGKPIAVVGIACRMPKADSKAEFWQMLLEGCDGVDLVPPERWDVQAIYDADRDVPGKTVSKWCGLTNRVTEFDAGFFGLSPEEARRMDPQQRLLLEVAWEALEDAGLAPSRLRGRSVGVFAGISDNEYARRQMSPPNRMGALTATGNARSIAANRLSYHFDWRGPSLAIDTACSSSLVALHSAVQSLRRGECELAVVAGVNLLLDPETGCALSLAGFLSPSGRCRAFDADADGYVRAEGCGVVILRPLDRAVADASRIYATVIGSSVNQDGRSNGLTAPNPQAQVDVISAACADAGVAPSSVQYVEAHGTGTALGDPIEVKALGTALRAKSTDASPLLVGSVKSNIGHLESAAGIAGLIKTALSLHHAVIPGNLHFNRPNPALRLEESQVEIVGATRPWPETSHPRMAGVSSFGFGGTNAHVLLAEAPASSAAPTPRQSCYPIVVSARSKKALAENLRRLGAMFGDDGTNLAAVSQTVCMRRDRQTYRFAAACASIGDAVARLAADTSKAAACPPQKPARTARPLAYVFSGQGGQFAGMAAPFLAASPLFRSVIKVCEDALEDQVDWRLSAVLADPSRVAEMESTEISQPCLVAMQIAQFHLLKSFGLEPSIVVGHSMGEISAAYAMGAIDLQSAMRLALCRGRRMAEASGGGRMLSVEASEAEILQVLSRYSGDVVSLAAVNAPTAVVVSGAAAALEEIKTEFERRERFVRLLPMNLASHSAQMTQAADRLADDVAWLAPCAGTVSMVSTVTGRKIAGTELGADYWRRNLRQTVRFQDAIGAVPGDAPFVFVELGGRPIMRAPLRQILGGRDADQSAIIGCLSGDDDGWRHFIGLLCDLFVMGTDVDFKPLFPAPLPPAELPPYAWDRSRHWIERDDLAASQSRVAQRPGDHPLLGGRLDIANPPGPAIWEKLLDVRDEAYLEDHRVGTRAVMPAACYLEMLWTAARALGAPSDIVLSGITFHAPLFLTSKPVRLQTIFSPRGGSLRASILSLTPERQGEWLLHVSASVSLAPASADAFGDSLGSCPSEISIAASRLFADLAASGLNYGPSFRRLTDIVVDRDMAAATIAPAVPLRGAERYCCDPRALDGALQSVAAIQYSRSELFSSQTFVPYHIARAVLRTLPSNLAGVRAKRRDEGGAYIADLDISDDRGAAAVLIRGLQLRPMQDPASQFPMFAYEEAWTKFAGGVHPRLSGTWIVLAGPNTCAFGPLAREMTKLGCAAALVHAADGAALDDAFATCEIVNEHGTASVKTAALRDIRGIVDLRALDREPAGAAASQASRAALELLQHWIGQDRRIAPRLVIVTRHSQFVRSPKEVREPWSAGIWGLVRSARLEFPDLDCRVVDLDMTDADRNAKCLVRELAFGDAEIEVAWREGQRFFRRLKTKTPSPSAQLTDALPVAPDGIYVVAGGTGGLGSEAVKWLAAKGARHVVTLGRTAPRKDAGAAFATDFRLRHLAVDITDRDALRLALAPIAAEGRIRGVLHCVGALSNSPIPAMTGTHVSLATDAKLIGAQHLSEMIDGRSLDWMALTSSASGALGAPGQANYAAANAALDAFCAMLQASGTNCFALAWGPWRQIGLTAGDAKVGSAWSADMALIDPDLAAKTLQVWPGVGRPQSVLLPVDLRDVVTKFAHIRDLPTFDEIWKDAPRAAAGAASERDDANADDVAMTALQRDIAAVWRRCLDVDRVGLHDQLVDLGGDSVLANQIVLGLNRAFGIRLDPQAAFADFTVEGLAGTVEQAIAGARSSAQSEEQGKAAQAGA